MKEKKQKQPEFHGLSKHPLYRVWVKIKDRLYNPNHEAYSIYGGNGVVMCEEWKNSAKKFIYWALDNNWKPGMVVDKDIIPRKLGIPAKMYSPEMCSIVTVLENNRCTQKSVYIEYKGEKRTISEWAERLKMDSATLHHRLFLFNYSVEESFEMPINYKKYRRIFYNGENKTIPEWAKFFGVKKSTLFYRIDNMGLSLEDAVNYKRKY